MAIGDIKNMTSQLVNQYERNSGAGVADVRHAGGDRNAVKSVGQTASPDVTVDFSSKSQDFVQIKSLMAQVPEVREEKVQALKTQIEAGSYQVDSAKIAGKMVKESLLDIFA